MKNFDKKSYIDFNQISDDKNMKRKKNICESLPIK